MKLGGENHSLKTQTYVGRLVRPGAGLAAKLVFRSSIALVVFSYPPHNAFNGSSSARTASINRGKVEQVAQSCADCLHDAACDQESTRISRYIALIALSSASIV